MSKLGSLYIQLGEPEGELAGCCETSEWAAGYIESMRQQLSRRDAEIAELKGHLEYALKAKRECYGERDQLHERVSALKTPPQLRQDLHCVASDLAQQVREAEQERDQLRDHVKMLQESSYAGVLMWIGERRIKQVITETEITHERISGQTITNAAQYCLEALAATEPKE